MELLKQAKHSLVILDGLMYCLSEIIAKILAIYSHHHKFIEMSTVQNLFYKALREITLNAEIVILSNNCRDFNQISSFLSQLFPEKYKNA